MKFFTFSLFVLLSSAALLGGSSATPAHEQHKSRGLLGDVVGGVVGGVVGLLDGTLSGLLQGLDHALAHISDAVREVLNRLQPVTEKVVKSVLQILHETGKGLALVADHVVDGIVTFVNDVTDGLISININIETLEISIGGRVIGTVHDGSLLVDLEGNAIGYVDPSTGYILLVGQIVDEVCDTSDPEARNVDGLLNNLLHSADELLNDVSDAVLTAVDNITPALRSVLDELPTVTSEVVQRVQELLEQTGNFLVSTIEGLKNNIVTFKETNGSCRISVNLGTLKVTVDGRIIGTLNNDGSIVNNHGQFIGLFDKENGLIMLVGDIVNGLLCAVGNVVEGLLG